MMMRLVDAAVPSQTELRRLNIKEMEKEIQVLVTVLVIVTVDQVQTQTLNSLVCLVVPLL